GADPLNVSLLNHSHQGLLGPSARFEPAWHVGPLPEFGDLQIDRPDPRIPLTFPIAVAVVAALRRPFVPLSANLLRYFQFHETLSQHPNSFPEEIHVVHTGLAQKLLQCDPKVGHLRVPPLRCIAPTSHGTQRWPLMSSSPSHRKVRGIYTTTLDSNALEYRTCRRDHHANQVHEAARLRSRKPCASPSQSSRCPVTGRAWWGSPHVSA